MTTHLGPRRCSRPAALERHRSWSATATATAELRVGDAERAESSALLGRAFTSGHLDVVEYEQRLEALTATRTHRDLAGLTGDLPVGELLRSDPERPARRRRAARLALGLHTGAAALSVVLCWLAWLIVALTTQAWYPWPVWPLLGALGGIGAHVLVHLLVTRGPTPDLRR